jgi:hypothetical protein
MAVLGNTRLGREEVIRGEGGAQSAARVARGGLDQTASLVAVRDFPQEGPEVLTNDGVAYPRSGRCGRDANSAEAVRGGFAEPAGSARPRRDSARH